MAYQVFNLKERPELAKKSDYLFALCWPEFMRHDPVADAYWGMLANEFAEFQLALCDEAGAVQGAGYSIPLAWDGTREDLPAGWDGEFLRGVEVYQSGRRPDTLGALAINVHPACQGQGLSKLLLGGMRQLGKAHGFRGLIAPVRPTLKSKYPLTPIERYAAWLREDGTSFDPWLRVHSQSGARIIQAAPRSMEIGASVAAWEGWTGLKFPESGSYVVPGALSPVEIDRAQDWGTYIEPNVWMVHALAEPA